MSYQPDVYKKAWIQTYTGIPYPILEPEPEYVVVEDIAHALSNMCRFAGHCREFYSVAQHAVLLSYQVPEEEAFAGLNHDDTEAYVVDMPRPLKHSEGLAGYRDVEESNWLAIAKRFAIDPVLPQSVKDADARMLLTEQRDLLGRQSRPWEDVAPPYDFVITPWSPKVAKAAFLKRFYELATRREKQWQTMPPSNSPWDLTMQQIPVSVLGT